MPGKPQSLAADDQTLADWIGDRATELSEQYAAAELGVAPCTYCPTGLRRLDDAGLLELGVCTVVLGHEGDGKSALGLQFLEGAATAGYDVQGYWPEDPRRFIADRVLAGQVGDSAAHLRRLKLEGAVADRLRAANKATAAWARKISVDDRRLSRSDLLVEIKRRWTPQTRLVVVDYAQVVGGAKDETNGERVINELVWDLNELAKDTGGAVVLLSQVRTVVKERGRRMFDSWKQRHPQDKPSAEAVEGYRPLSGDGQWAPNALGQKARAVLSWFRPNQWLRMHGADVPDDMAELFILKSNYGPAMEKLKLRWHGPTTRITDPKEGK